MRIITSADIFRAGWIEGPGAKGKRGGMRMIPVENIEIVGDRFSGKFWGRLDRPNGATQAISGISYANGFRYLPDESVCWMLFGV